MESNPALISKFIHAQTLRKTKNDAIDSQSIARWLMTVDCKPYPKGFYHTYSLKSLTRLRDSVASQMLSFAGLEPGYYQSGTMEFRGKMVKRGSSQLRYALMNCVVPLIRFDPVFASYYHKKRLE